MVDSHCHGNEICRIFLKNWLEVETGSDFSVTRLYGLWSAILCNGPITTLCLKKNIPDIFDCNLKTTY